MDLKSGLLSAVQRLPPAQRAMLRRVYQRLPGYGRKDHYSQYGEDSFLQAYFRQRQDLTPGQPTARPALSQHGVGTGYWVDVGAHHPISNSNTYWFYRRGWRGINIDSAPGTRILFQRFRPGDTNVEALISDEETRLVFHHWDTPFLFNTVSADDARMVARRWGRESRPVTLRSRRLDRVLDEQLPPGQPISFLSVDTEGHDLHVLRSSNWDRYHPELVLVEDHSMSEPHLAASEVYRFMWSVGYEMYAWLRPTVVYRRIGLPDWLNPLSLTP